MNGSKLFLLKLRSRKKEEFYKALTQGYLDFFYDKNFKKSHFRELNTILRYKYALNIHEHLSLQEMRCLYLAAYGKNTKEIAYLLKISPTTVEEYKKKLFKKMNVNNMPQAVMKGFYILDHRDLIY